jgi:oligosaccharide repeat unit polymerase
MKSQSSLLIIKKFRIKLINLIIILFYAVILNIIYPNVNSVVNYMWKLVIIFSYKKFIINLVLIILAYIIIPKNNTIIFNLFCVILCFIYVPITVIVNYTIYKIEVSIIFIISFIIVILVYKIILGLPKIVTNYNINEKNIEYIFLLYTIFFVIYIARKYKIQGNIIYVLINSYSIRNNVKFTGIDGYLVKGYISLISPILMYIGIKNKKIKVALFALIINIILFIIFAYKNYALYGILILSMTFIYKHMKRNKKFIIPITALLISIIAIFIGSISFPYIDRFIYLPGLLNVLYFDYFTNSPYNYFHGSKIGLLFGIKNYDQELGFVIDKAYFGGGSNANTGYFGTSYAELGYNGIILASVILGIILYIIYLASKKNSLLAFATGLFYMFELMNSSIFALFLTNFFIVYIIIIFYIKIDNT